MVPMDRMTTDQATRSAQATPGVPPISKEGYALRAARAALGVGPLQVRVETNTADNPVRPQSSRSMVRWLLSALSPIRAAEAPSLPKDLEALRRAVGGVLDAVDADVITAEEGDAVVNFIVERFITRRFDEVFARATSPGRGSWFVLHHGQMGQAE